MSLGRPAARSARPAARATAHERVAHAVVVVDETGPEARAERSTPSPTAGASNASTEAPPAASRRVAARRRGHATSAPAEPRTRRGAPASLPPDEFEPGLSRLLRDVDGASHDAGARERAAAAIAQIAARLAPHAREAGASLPDELFGAARQRLARHWGAASLQREVVIDDFGLDRLYASQMQPVFDWLFERYFQVEVEGIENIPATGAALLVCNHGGILPWDGVMLKTAIRGRGPDNSSGRDLRWLIEDSAYHAPFLGAFLNRLGAVRACQENAERLLGAGELLAVFPEGDKGIGKRFRDRYRLQRFGRGGYVKLALRTGVPLIPVAIVGAEETYPLLHRVTAFSRLLGLPFIPVTPLFPWLGPLGLVPLPSRWRISIGGEVRNIREKSPEVANDAAAVSALSEQVRGELQRRLDASLAQRGPRAYAWPVMGRVQTR